MSAAAMSRIDARRAQLVARAEILAEMVEIGEGSSALVELALIEDEMEALRDLTTALLLDRIKARHA